MKPKAGLIMTEEPTHSSNIFSGNIFIFHAFDIGYDIDIEKVKTSLSIMDKPLQLPKYFKNYHIPLEVELPHPHTSSKNISVKIHNFGAISLTYKIPFKSSLEQARKDLVGLDNQYKEQSIEDGTSIFNKIKEFTVQPNFYNTSSSYLVIQLDHQKMNATTLKEKFGGMIASMVRFETQQLAEYQKNEILESSIGYFKGDLIVIDTEAAFIYDPEYEEILGFFEFANIQLLELQYFDRLLDKLLNVIYEGQQRKIPFKRYLPFFSLGRKDPIEELGRLKVDISVITERLEGSIKLSGEPFYSEIYELLIQKRGLRHWQDTVHKKLEIIRDIRSVLQHKIDSIREDLLNVLIIILIFIELIVGVIHLQSL